MAVLKCGEQSKIVLDSRNLPQTVFFLPTTAVTISLIEWSIVPEQIQFILRIEKTNRCDVKNLNLRIHPKNCLCVIYLT